MMKFAVKFNGPIAVRYPRGEAYDGLEDESIKRLYFPTVVFVLEGEVVGIHIDTIESQKDPRVPLTEKQKNELINIYVNNINKLSDDICDDKC